jgi:transcriptional regulator
MYIPKHFNEPNLKVMHDLMRTNPLATLVTTTLNGLNANHIPLILVENESFGILQGHVARANPIWQESLSEIESLAVFHGVNSYISPSFYATKKENGKVVPTWNYAVVHAYGTLRIIDDAVWLRSQIERLTAQQESSFPESWKLTDAPNDYIEKLILAVVGIEIVITKLEGKWKVSQNQPEQNKEIVVVGLENRSDTNDAEMIELVSGKKYESKSIS